MERLWSRVRPPAVLVAGLVVVLLGATACGTVDVAAPPTAGGLVQGEAGVGQHAWTVRRAGPRALMLSFVGAPPGDGPCDSRLRAVARESPAEVALSVVDDNANRGKSTDGGPLVCPAVGYGWALQVDLGEDLGARRLVDPRGAELAVLDVLETGWLPPGYAFMHERGGPGAHFLNYGSDDGGWLVVTTWHVPPGSEQEAMLTPVGERDGVRMLELAGLQRVAVVDVTGTPAWVTWMRAHEGGPAPLSWDELARVAGSLR